MSQRLPTERVLNYLARNEAESIPEIAASLNLAPTKVRATVRLLAGDGRIQPLGTSSTNARCYGVTVAGRAWLNANASEEN